LGVIWDGTGYGDDGAVWGGEFFVYGNYQMTRYCHLQYYPHLARDKMPKEPRLSAFSICQKMESFDQLLRPKFNQEEWRIYSHLIQKNDLLTSSMGRLFDAISSLLGLTDHNTYEGEAAMYLERKGRIHHEQNADIKPYSISLSQGTFELMPMISEIIKDIQAGLDSGLISVRFHLTLVEMVDVAAMKLGVYHIAFSGGVFQNAFLVDLLIDRLAGKYHLYFHEQLSPNDECVCYGQLAYFYIQNMYSDTQPKPSPSH